MSKFLALSTVFSLLILPIQANARNFVVDKIGLYSGHRHHNDGGGHIRRYGQRYNYSSRYSTYPQRNGVRAYSGGSAGKYCRPTYKHVYDAYGNIKKINGTLCYDLYGQAYIVPGSRYEAYR